MRFTLKTLCMCAALDVWFIYFEKSVHRCMVFFSVWLLRKLILKITSRFGERQWRRGQLLEESFQYYQDEAGRRWEWDRNGGSSFHTPHWVRKRKESAGTVKSLCSVLCRGEVRGHRWEIKMTGSLKAWKKQDKCHYQFRLSCFLTFVYSRRGFSGSSLFVCWVISVYIHSV